MRNFAILWLLLSVTSYWLVQAQIPKVCSSKSNLTNRTCCPVPSGASTPCGRDLDRGQCHSVSSYCYTQYPNNGDPRLNWPFYFFNRTCHCYGNYSGYDCGECKFGYEGNNCNTKSSPLRQRKSIAKMNESEWEEYNSKLNRSKHTNESRYVILLFNETDGNAFNAKPVNISVYDMFTWMHHYAAKNNDGGYNITGSANDYAHESTGFLTWHRLFLLWFEREIQILLNDSSFTIHYWNWTNTSDRTSIFSFNKLGNNSDNGTVNSKYYGGNNWKCVCWFPSDSTKQHQTCNPNDPDSMMAIVRCPSPTECAGTYSKWPSRRNISKALSLSSYSNRPYNKYSESSFRNFLEGFQPDPNPNPDIAEVGSDNIIRLLHNIGHIIVGIGSFNNIMGSNPIQEGTMANVAASPNDPVFFNHHTMVDSIFEQWLQRYPNGEYGGPKNDSKFAGHSANDCIVPFIPVYKHVDIFKPAENFGYIYDFLSSSTSTGSTTPSIGPTPPSTPIPSTGSVTPSTPSPSIGPTTPSIPSPSPTMTTDSFKGIFVDGSLILLTLMSSLIIILHYL